MAANNERGDQHELSPEGSFPPQGQSQYSHPQPPYSFQQSTDYPPLSEHDINIATQAYSQPIQQNLAALQDATQNTPGRNGDDAMRNTNGSAMPGMAPPQNNAQFSPAIGRGSVDHTPESGTPVDGKNKSKPKASQACDECRRKKTKCITTIGEDGIPTTCSSCAKGGLECQYSRQPLKRGPNKGYIKDLADRVQQVESLMTQPGYRQSFDGDMFATGEEPMSARRHFSLTSGGRNSFSGPDFRDRFGSLGAFTPMSSAPRQRDRFSIAVPPDQQPTSMNFYDDIEQRPSKRLKMDSEKLPALAPIQLDSTVLAKYYDIIHPQFSLLPDSSETAIQVIEKASTDLQHALVATIGLLPSDPASSAIASSKSAVTTVKEMAERMTAAYEDQITSAANAIVYIWTSSMLLIHAEYGIDSIGSGPVPSQTLIRNSTEIMTRLKTSKPTSLLTDDKLQGLDLTTLQDLISRSYCLTLLQNKLLLIATAGTTWNDTRTFPSIDEVESTTSLTPQARFLAFSTKAIAYTITLLINQQYDSECQGTIKLAVTDVLELIAATRAPLEPTSQLYQQLEEFLKLLSARTTHLPTSLDCLMPAAKLAEKLGSNNTTYSPLDIHLYTTCVFTFLEVLALPSTPNNEFAGPVALTGLNSIRPVLQEKVSLYTSTRSAADKVFWGTTEGKETIKKSWMEALLLHIDAAERKGWVNENTIKYQNSGSLGVVPDVTGSFGQLVDWGYLVLLGYYAGVIVREEMGLGDGGEESGNVVEGNVGEFKQGQ